MLTLEVQFTKLVDNTINITVCELSELSVRSVVVYYWLINVEF